MPKWFKSPKRVLRSQELTPSAHAGALTDVCPACAERPSDSAAKGWDEDTERLLDAIRAGLKKNEFELFYQPKVNARTGEVAGVEALLRWNNDAMQDRSIGELIEIAEQTGIIREITDWVIDASVRDLDTLTAIGHKLKVSVNVSASIIGDAETIQYIIERAGHYADQMIIEITETAIMHARSQAQENLQTLAEAGFSLSLDDYGAGYSSLSQLQTLPLHELKIDREFISSLTDSHRGPLIVRSTIELAHALELEVVAEGIEEAETFALLAVMGCDLLQGYLICRPLPLYKLVEYINDIDAPSRLLNTVQTMPLLGLTD